MKVIIVGGVAGGASCAARLRWLDERAEIIMVERGPYVSYANCGVALPRRGCDRARVRSARREPAAASASTSRLIAGTGCEAIGVSPGEKTVELRDVASGEVSTEPYDKLVLSPGAPSIRPQSPESIFQASSL